MNENLLINTRKSQECYYQILKRHENTILSEDPGLKQIAQIIDEINFFWLEQYQIIEFELERLTKNFKCFLLSGAVYLGNLNAEHFYFKSLGDYHLISEPFLKINTYFRMPDDKDKNHPSKEYFKKVYIDVINILENFKDHFYILPIKIIAYGDQSEQFSRLQELFLNIISASFGKEFISEETFCEEFSNFEEIEKNMPLHFKEALIFDTLTSPDAPLREKILNYLGHQMGTSHILKSNSEPKLFLFASFALISQMLEILLTCSLLNLNPYIRHPITFNYLITFRENFADDEEVREIIENAILSFILTKAINKERFLNIDFSEYCNLMQKKEMLVSLRNEFKRNGIDIFACEFRKIEGVILETFSSIEL
ncbi:hypothetical protein LEP1GSC050_4161 [Leptospira broomii serovar Hurstbridge str. 5399]|uniref:Uncharacterized protein n=1 Tax=Leptospira broomii serovar Hurstbridge str. 5399 TaxID=1049789 RepID=T0F937_9LEPT|nr:hypothetical protein [Leptospira broomii]EQA44032.1 hypothetical protein LEP1GSC050_4161 [Leptospira broomii serovar Hurstbridge str. 5399]